MTYEAFLRNVVKTLQDISSMILGVTPTYGRYPPAKELRYRGNMVVSNSYQLPVLCEIPREMRLPPSYLLLQALANPAGYKRWVNSAFMRWQRPTCQVSAAYMTGPTLGDVKFSALLDLKCENPLTRGNATLTQGEKTLTLTWLEEQQLQVNGNSEQMRSPLTEASLAAIVCHDGLLPHHKAGLDLLTRGVSDNKLVPLTSSGQDLLDLLAGLVAGVVDARVKLDFRCGATAADVAAAFPMLNALGYIITGLNGETWESLPVDQPFGFVAAHPEVHADLLKAVKSSLPN